MADASYDAIVVGSGHNGMITACYLAYSGLSVAVFEREHKLGGCACSEELPLPGFVSNPCAHSTRFYSHPAYSDFKLAEKGLDLVFPEAGQGAIFEDGTSIVTYPTWPCVDKMTGRTEFSEQNAEKTFQSIARISEQDAETARSMFELFRTKWLPAVTEARHNPPKPWGEKDAVEKLMDDPESGFDPIYSVMSTEQMARDLWESPEMQCFFMRRVTGTATAFPEDVLGPAEAATAIGMVLSVFGPSIPIGGTRSIIYSLQRALAEMGGKCFVQSEVDKLLIENGRAKGVRLADGTEIEAKQLVVSNLNLDLTVNRLIGSEHVSPKVSRRASNVHFDRGGIYWCHVGMHELPRYKSFDYDPDSALLHCKVLLPKDPDYVAAKHKAELFTKGIPSQMELLIWLDTQWTDAKTPPGKHLAVVEQYACPSTYFSERQWLQMKTQLADEIVRQWQWYAPNMTPDNIIGFFVNTPYDVEQRNQNCYHGSCTAGGSLLCFQAGRFRPIPELSGYRMPIENLYLASTAAHAGFGCRGTQGYNCYKVVARDLGLRKVWEEKGRPY